MPWHTAGVERPSWRRAGPWLAAMLVAIAILLATARVSGTLPVDAGGGAP